MLKEVTKATNLVVTDHRFLVLVYPLIWLWVWCLVEDFTTIEEDRKKFDAKVKASLERIRKEESDRT